MRGSVVLGPVARRASRPLLRPRLLSTASSQPHYPLWLDGQPVEAADGATLPIEDPSTATAFATTALGSEADIAAAVASAKRCHEEGEWKRMGARGRGRVLRAAAEKLRERLPSLVELETRATGRARREYEAQLGRVPEWLEYHASLAESVEGTVPPFADATDHLAIVRRRPLGVCGLITPWNHPLLSASPPRPAAHPAREPPRARAVRARARAASPRTPQLAATTTARALAQPCVRRRGLTAHRRPRHPRAATPAPPPQSPPRRCPWRSRRATRSW